MNIIQINANENGGRPPILINECGLPELVPVEYGGTATKEE